MNNMDNQLIIAVTMVYAVNCLILFNWIIDLPEVFNGIRIESDSYLVAALYVLLFLVSPLLSLCLFSATPELTESRQFLQLPWKPINKVLLFLFCIICREKHCLYPNPSQFDS